MVQRRVDSPTPLHRLYLIADIDTARRYDVDIVEVVGEFVRAGGRMVSLRPDGRDDQYLLEVGRKLAGLVFSVRGLFLIHRRADLAMLLGADGVHLPSRGLRRRNLVQLMGRSVIAGRSCHRRWEVEDWAQRGGSFATLSPLFSSISKPGYGPDMELDEFRDIAEASQMPLYALGGVVPEKVDLCLEAGAEGVAVVGGIMGATSVFDATRRYLEAITESVGSTHIGK